MAVVMGGAEVVDQVSTRRPHLYKDVDQSAPTSSGSASARCWTGSTSKWLLFRWSRRLVVCPSLLYSPFWVF